MLCIKYKMSVKRLKQAGNYFNSLFKFIFKLYFITDSCGNPNNAPEAMEVDEGCVVILEKIMSNLLFLIFFYMSDHNISQHRTSI